MSDISPKLDHGRYGFKRIVPVDGNVSPDKGSFHALKAIGGDVTFDTGMSVNEGDAPISGEVLQQGDVLSGNFSQVGISGGVIYAYYSAKQP